MDKPLRQVISLLGNGGVNSIAACGFTTCHARPSPLSSTTQRRLTVYQGLFGTKLQAMILGTLQGWSAVGA
eukprot:1684502-Amphidinium_carterae.1